MLKVILGFILFMGLQAEALVDDSISIFFPKELKSLEATQTKFPFFWWNFIIIEPSALDKVAQFDLAEKICSDLNAKYVQQIAHIICGGKFDSFLPQLQNWALDYPKRKPYSEVGEREVQRQSDLTMTQVSFFSELSLVKLLRYDPFSQWQVLADELRKVSANAFQMRKGYLYDEETRRLIIPIQFRVPPKKSNVEDLFSDFLRISGVSIIGPHASSYINEKQVMDDLNVVSFVGALSLVFFAVLLLLKGRKNIISLFIPVFAAVVLATFLVELVFGSIHGLTLAFGSGIIGLVLDYGLHGAFNAHSRQTWKSNSVGLITTLVGLSGLLFCSIPLIQQMMFFSISGLGIGYAFFYYLCRYHSRFFSIEGLLFRIPHIRLVSFFSVALAFMSFFVATRISWTVDLKSMNFHRPGDQQIFEWFYNKNDMGETLLSIQKNEERGDREYRFAISEGISYEGIRKYLPPKTQQKNNLKTWRDQFCPNVERIISRQARKFFTPFIYENCLNEEGSLENKPAYIRHLQAGEENLSVFFAQNEVQKQKIKENFPYFESIQDHFRAYSRIFENDLRKIIPLVFFVCFMMLYFYYRRVLFVFSSFVPFFCGTGLYFTYLFIRNERVDLMGLVGLIMVFCFSLDYGIFATDIVAFPQAKENAVEIRSSILFAALSNLLGYFPMVFAQHVVLQHLGMALFLGTIGTLLGSIWGIPVIALWGQKK